MTILVDIVSVMSHQEHGDSLGACDRRRCGWCYDATAFFEREETIVVDSAHIQGDPGDHGHRCGGVPSDDDPENVTATAEIRT